MSTITADPNMLSVLSQVKVVTEIRDGKGNLIGIFTPKDNADEDIKKLFDMDKARERYAKEKDRCRPFRQIIDELQKRGDNPG